MPDHLAVLPAKRFRHGPPPNSHRVPSSRVTCIMRRGGRQPIALESMGRTTWPRDTPLECDGWKGVSAETKELLYCMLQPDPSKRLSAKEALKHKCLQGAEWCRNQSNPVLADTEETAMSPPKKRTRSDSDSSRNDFFDTPRHVALCSSPDCVAYPYLCPSADCDVDIDLASFRTKMRLN